MVISRPLFLFETYVESILILEFEVISCFSGEVWMRNRLFVTDFLSLIMI